MAITVYKKEYKAPEIDTREALRYAGVRGESPETEALLREVISESGSAFTYKVAYVELAREEAFLRLGLCEEQAEAQESDAAETIPSATMCDAVDEVAGATPCDAVNDATDATPCKTVADDTTRSYSSLFSSRLSGAERVIIFVASVGITVDRLIKRYEVTSSARAVLLDALGAERVEALCDEFSRDIAEEKAKDGIRLLPRFSPGYGDLPLSVGARIISLTNATKLIGVSMNESLLMSPSKSVSAIIGLVRETH